MHAEKKLAIGTLELANRSVLAPMAGVTDRAYREMVRRWAPDSLVSIEMIHAQGLVQSKKLADIAKIYDIDHPVLWQLQGNDPFYLARAAEMGQELGADTVNLNMACPVPKIVKNGDGAAMMCDLPKSEKAIQAIVQAITVPFSVKIRAGWDQHSINAVEVAKMSEANGAQAVLIHGRTARQMYSGLADWDVIKAVKEAVKIPVIGSGDIWEPADATRRIEETGLDGIITARGGLGRPWLVGQIARALAGEPATPFLSHVEMIDEALYHYHLAIEYIGEARGVPEMRKHLGWYIKGMPESAEIRERINLQMSADAVREILLDYRQKMHHLATVVAP